jgi:FAD/FMN-containing dehydrogenase
VTLTVVRPASRHHEATQRLLAQYAAIPPGETVRLAKRTSNLFRNRPDTARPGLDVSGLDQVLSVDPVARTADVQAMTTYEDLVEATLAHGLMPLVVPQLKTITIGGAVTGLGIESSSYRNGLPHESVRELEILTGAGEVVVATPDGEHADLFRTFPNSYGTLGYALRMTIELEPVQPFVMVRHIRFTDLDALQAAIAQIVATSDYDGHPVDFLDGTMFTPSEAYLSLGSWADDAPYTSDYTGQQIYYRSIQSRSVDFLTVKDYLWRWDTDWFWCSRAFGAQNRWARKVWPRRWLRSNVYWKIVAFEDRHHVMSRIDARRGLPARERVIQDVEIPMDRTADFLRWFDREVPIEPVWICPIQLRPKGSSDRLGTAAEQTWPLYPLEPGQLYVNVGFWSTVAIEPGRSDGDVNRMIENQVHEVGGHKSLYSDAYYSPEEFAARYGGETYAGVKQRYDPKGRLLDLYAKAVSRR